MKKYIVLILIAFIMASCNKEVKEREEKREDILNMFNNKNYSTIDDTYIIKFTEPYTDLTKIFDIDSNFLSFVDGSCILIGDFQRTGIFSYALSRENDQLNLYKTLIDGSIPMRYHEFYKSYKLVVHNNNEFELVDGYNILYFNYLPQ